MARQGIAHPSSKPVLIGVELGALAGALVIGAPNPWRPGRHGERAPSTHQEVSG
jgi:hypothetical protein